MGLDEAGRPTGEEEIIDCDTLIFSRPIPENELSKRAGY
jgi:hypothetical protein